MSSLTLTRKGQGSTIANHSGSASNLMHNPVTPGSSGLPQRVFTVSVVGLSGTEKDKGPIGVGKSCLCNRFIRPLEDDYMTEHASTLSQADFASPVINNDHWLYWGDRTLIMTNDNGDSLSNGSGHEWIFRVIEQTEFLDDESFQPMRGSNQRESYCKRAAATKLHSPDKLMYICKDQLGLETEYEQVLLQPEGRLTVDGFICVYDVSFCPSRPYSSQTDYITNLLAQIVKTKKPVVLVATKNDEATQEGLKEMQKVLSRKELRNLSVPVVESSAHKGINVESAFSLLGYLMQKQQGSKSSASPILKPRLMSYRDAMRSRHEVMQVASDAYLRKLQSVIVDHRVAWQQVCREMSRDHDFVHFCDLFGRAQAQKVYRQHLKELRDQYLKVRLESHTARLPEVFRELLPEVETVRGRSWKDLLSYIQCHPNFGRYFMPVGTLGDSMDRAIEMSDRGDPRIPGELLFANDAEIAFRNHVNFLEKDWRRNRLRESFEDLLAHTSQVTPGKPMADVKIFLMGKEAFEALQEQDASEIYEVFQNHLIKKARLDFVELLLENVEEFVGRILFPKVALNSSSDSASSNHKMPGLSDKDMKIMRDKLQEDIRYRQLNRLFEARDNMIGQYASFTAFPLRAHCPAGCRCADALIEQILIAKMHRPDSLPLGIKVPPQLVEKSALVDLTICGADSLAQNLLSEIRLHIPQDRYYPEGEAHSVYATGYNLKYRCIDSNLESSPSSLFPASPSPDQCMVAVFSSKKSLEKLRSSLAHALIISATSTASDPNSNKTKVLPPAVLILACDPRHLDDLPYLQQQGAQLADSLKCPFIGVGSSGKSQDRSPRDRGSRASLGPALFSREQIGRLMDAIIKQRRQQVGTVNIKENTDFIDLRITMCIMCGDSDYSPHCIIGPLLNHQCTNAKLTNTDYEVQDSKFVVETFLPGCSRKVRVEIQAAAYHTALVRHATKASTPHPDGYILIYSTRRPASLRHLQALVRRMSPGVTPILMMAVGDVAEFFSDKATNALMTEGNEIADHMNARFVTVSPATEQQIGSYTSFFEEALNRKHSNKPMPPRRNPPELKQPVVLSVDEGHYATLSEFRSGPDRSLTDPTGWCGDDFGGSMGSRRPVVDSMSPLIGRLGNQRAYSQSTTSSGRGSYEQLLASSGDSAGAGGTAERDESKLMGGGMDDSAIAEDTSNDTPRPVGHGWWDLSDSPRFRRRMGEGPKENKKEGISGFFKQSLAQKIGRTSLKSEADNWRMEKGQPAPHAPLATPENIELNVDSANKAAMSWSCEEGVYASVVTVHDADEATHKKSEDSSSNADALSSLSEREDSSLEKLSKTTLTPDEPGPSKDPESPYSKTGRKPTPHRRNKKTRGPVAQAQVGAGIAERLKLLNKEFYNVAVPGAPEPFVSTESENGMFLYNGSQIMNQRHHHIQRNDGYPSSKYSAPFPYQIMNPQLKKVMFKSASEESLLNPTIRHKTESDWMAAMAANDSAEYADTEDTEQEENTDPVQTKKNKGFVRKVASSFRFKKKKMICADISLPLSNNEGTKSVPQSPLLTKKRAGVYVLPPFQNLDQQAGFAVTSEGSSNLLDPKQNTVVSKSVPPSPRKDNSSASREDLLAPSTSRTTYSKKLSAPNSTQGFLSSKPRRLSDQGRKKSGSPGISALVPPGATLRDMAPSLEDPIPTFLRRCVEFIEGEGGLTLEGLYRVPGNQAQVTLLEQKFTENPSISFRSLDLPVNAVATSLKNFFSYLADPPIPAVLYDELVAMLAEPFENLDGKLRSLQIMMRRLPSENRFVLRYFIAHLKRVAAHAHQNSMDLRNLAKCWWPTMLRPHFDSFEMMAHLTPRLEEFIQLLFEHADILLISGSPMPT